MQKAFKSKMFGGFDKKDVFNYIEGAVVEKQTQLDALELEKLDLKNEIEKKDSELENLRKLLDEQAEQITRLEQSVADCTKELADIETKKQEVDQLFAKYDDQKSTIANIELDAHRRAIATKNQVDEYIVKAAHEFNKALDVSRDGYTVMKADAQNMLSALIDKLSDAKTQVNDIYELFDGTAQMFDSYKLDVNSITKKD